MAGFSSDEQRRAVMAALNSGRIGSKKRRWVQRDRRAVKVRQFGVTRTMKPGPDLMKKLQEKRLSESLYAKRLGSAENTREIRLVKAAIKDEKKDIREMEAAGKGAMVSDKKQLVRAYGAYLERLEGK